MVSINVFFCACVLTFGSILFWSCANSLEFLAENAKLVAQYQVIGKKPVRIMFQKNMREKKNEANLFIKNIDTSVPVKELHNYFANVGAVLAAKIATNDEGESLGYGYVQFENPEDAQKGLRELNGKRLKEHELQITAFIPREMRNATAKRNLYLKHLPTGQGEKAVEQKIRVSCYLLFAVSIMSIGGVE